MTSKTNDDNSSKNDLLNNFIPQLKNLVQSETVFGAPYTLGEITFIPVNSVKVGFGFGNGSSKKEQDGTGGGGGVLLTPVAFIVIKGETVTVHNLKSDHPIEKILEKTPDFIEKISRLLEKKKKSSN